MNVHSVWSGWTCVAACGRRSDVGCSVVGEMEGEKKGSVHLPPIMGRDSQPNRSRPNHHHRVFFALGREKRDGLCLREKQNHG